MKRIRPQEKTLRPPHPGQTHKAAPTVAAQKSAPRNSTDWALDEEDDYDPDRFDDRIWDVFREDDLLDDCPPAGDDWPKDYDAARCED